MPPKSKAVAAKRGAGRPRSIEAPAPPAKKSRKETSKPTTFDVENIDPKGDASRKKAKSIGQTVPEVEKTHRKEALKPATFDVENMAPAQDACTKKSETVAAVVPEPEIKKPMAQVIPADPVLQRVAVVQNAMEDEKQVGLLKLPLHVNDMLRIAVPTALGNGSAADERHGMQSKMADTIGIYLQQVVDFCANLAKEEEGLVQAAITSKSQAASDMQALQTKLDETVFLVKEKQENLNDAEQALSAAKERVPQPQIDALDAELQRTRSQRDQYQKVITSSFDVLKACDWSSAAEQKKGEKKLFGPLNTLVKQIGADPSLVEAATNALAKNPAQRGNFDIMVVTQLEDVLRQPLTVLDEQIRQQETDKEEKNAEMQESNAAVALVEQQLSTCQDELTACRKRHVDLEAHTKELTTATKESDLKLQQARSAHDTKVSLLEEAKKSFEAFRFLYERRITPVPETATKLTPEVAEDPQTDEQVSNDSTMLEADATKEPPEHREVNPTMSPATEELMSKTDVEVSAAEEFASKTDVEVPAVKELLLQTDVELPAAEELVSKTDVEMPTVEEFVSRPDVEVPRAEEVVSKTDVEMPAAEEMVSKTDVEVPAAEELMSKTDVAMPAEELFDTQPPPAEAPSAQETEIEVAEEPVEKADPCWEFVKGLEPGSDPFADKKANFTDSSRLKEECRNLNAVAVTTAGRIKFSLPPRNEWVPQREEDDEFGTWVWNGDDKGQTSQSLEDCPCPAGFPVARIPPRKRLSE